MRIYSTTTPARVPEEVKGTRATLRRVGLNQGGRDRLGRFYGDGLPVWEAVSPGFVEYVRAVDRAAAKARVQELHPDAEFFR